MVDKRVRVLIVDDAELIRDTLSEMLAAHEFDVHSAEHGAAALAALPAWSPDVVLLDLAMPVMDGWTFLARLQADEALRGTVCVVVLSAYADDDATRARARDAGALDCLTKGLASVDQIVTTIRNANRTCHGLN